MQNKATLAAYNLKWNPFSFDVPYEGLIMTPKMESFCDRIEDLVIDGGFAMISGEPGTGKSVMLRILAERLGSIRDLSIANLTRPQSGIIDFYREITMNFAIEANFNNRWSTYKSLRDRWFKHIESTLIRPVIFIDEAQQTLPAVLSELRILSSANYDSKSIATIILCGDERLPEKLQTSELLPLASRIRTRFIAQPYSRDELIHLLQERMAKAGNAQIMTRELVVTLAEHSMGNPRIMITMADELFSKGIKANVAIMDESMFLAAYQRNDTKRKGTKR